MTSFVHNKCKYSGWGREREGGREGEREERESTTMYCTVQYSGGEQTMIPYCTVQSLFLMYCACTHTVVLIFFFNK